MHIPLKITYYFSQAQKLFSSENEGFETIACKHIRNIGDLGTQSSSSRWSGMVKVRRAYNYLHERGDHLYRVLRNRY